MLKSRQEEGHNENKENKRQISAYKKKFEQRDVGENKTAVRVRSSCI